MAHELRKSGLAVIPGKIPLSGCTIQKMKDFLVLLVRRQNKKQPEV